MGGQKAKEAPHNPASRMTTRLSHQGRRRFSAAATALRAAWRMLSADAVIAPSSTMRASAPMRSAASAPAACITWSTRCSSPDRRSSVAARQTLLMNGGKLGSRLGIFAPTLILHAIRPCSPLRTRLTEDYLWQTRRLIRVLLADRFAVSLRAPRCLRTQQFRRSRD